jgi:hypothetical protein
MLYSPLAMSFQKNSIFNSSSPAAASRIYNFTFDAPRTHPESLFSKGPNLLRIDPKKSLLPKKFAQGAGTLSCNTGWLKDKEFSPM